MFLQFQSVTLSAYLKRLSNQLAVVFPTLSQHKYLFSTEGNGSYLNIAVVRGLSYVNRMCFMDLPLSAVKPSRSAWSSTPLLPPGVVRESNWNEREETISSKATWTNNSYHWKSAHIYSLHTVDTEYKHAANLGEFRVAKNLIFTSCNSIVLDLRTLSRQSNSLCPKEHKENASP